MVGNTKKLLYVFDSAPYSSSAGSEALEAVLIGANFEQDISLLFINNGVFQIKRDQSTKGSLMKPFFKTYSALEDFEVTNIYSHDLSLLARGLDARDLMIPASVLTSAEVAQLLNEQDKVFTF